MQSSFGKMSVARSGLFGALVAIVLAIGLVPHSAFAAETLQPDSSSPIRSFGVQDEEVICNSVSIPAGVPTKNAEGEDVVYLSVSDDGTYLVSDGALSNVTMANVAVPIWVLAEIQLSDYGLERYTYQVDGVDQVTALHLYLYMLEYYFRDGTQSFTVEGAPGSLFITNFWGFEPEINFTYYANGEYPLKRVAWGATADQIVLRPGLHIDVAHFSNMGFYTDSNAGHCYFYDPAMSASREAITLGYSGYVGETIELGVLRAGAKMSEDPSGSDYSTGYYAEAGQDVYCASSYKGEDTVTLGATDEDGKVSATFTEPGTYYVWMDGLEGESTEDIVSGPAMATVTVTPVPNSLPALAEGVLATAEAEIGVGSAYTLDLSTIFADPDGDELAYTVAVDGADAVAANASYSFTPETVGTHTLVFGANDGKADSADTYTVTLTAKSAAAEPEQAAADGLPVGSTFTVKDKTGTWTYKVTAPKQVTLTKAAKTKKKGKATINTASHQGVTYSVTAIGPKALKGSGLAKVTIGDNVTSIGKLAFQENKNLKALTVGRNVASIGAKAFSGDKELKKITVKSSKLTAAKAVKGALKGSKVRTVKLSGVKGAAKKKAKKAFAKAGKKGVTVK